MKATWFENKELITLYTDPAYFGADVPDSYARKPSKPVPVKSLFGYEPSSKMDDIHHKDSMLKIALQMKSGTWDGPPIVVRKDPKGYQVLDGHHRMHAARKAGIDTLDAVVVDREDIEYSDEVKEQTNKVVNESYELEFVCVNPDFCDATEQKNQDSLFQALKAVPGVIVYKQDFDVHNSMAAIIKDEADKDAPKLIKRLAQQNKVAIDLKNNVNQRRMDDIITGRLEGLTDYYDTDYLSEASGYIPTAAQANDPRFKTALTVDVRPGEDQRNIEKLGLNLNMDLVNKTKPGRKYKKRTLKEAPQDWSDMKLDGDKTQQSIDYFYTDHAPNKIGNRREAGNFKGFNVVTFTKDADTLMFLVDNKDRAVFYVAFTDMKDGVAVGNVRSNGTVRATEVYAFLVDKFKTLYSDKHQTPQGRKIWTDFAKFFPNIKVTDTGERLKATTLEESLMERYQAIKEEDLLEVEMSPGALRSWAKSDEAKGVRAGFELELIFADTQRETDEYGDEADMDYDEPIGTLDDISTFYGYEDAWLNLQPVDEDRFREAVIEDLMDYEAKLVVERMMDEEYELIRDKLEGDENFESMDEDAQDVFLEKEVREQGDIWTEVEEEVKEEVHGSVTWDQFWEHENIQAMSDLLNRYDLVWPHYVEEGGGTSVDSWAQEISEITGKGTNVSAQYHGSDKEEGKYTLEPDSSLSVDDGPDAGWELVSPVMPLDEALDQLEKLFNYIEEKDGDIYTNESTGLHMNISVPQGNDIDYTKLVLFSGDKFILDKYNRLSNNYAASALGQLEARAAQLPPGKAAQAMQKMKDNLEDTAEEYVRAGTGQAKYTSIHIKDGYIEFRGPGGMYTNKSFGENMNTMLRFARAMTIAADPQAYKQEYQKKLYKTLSKSESSERTIDSLFADFQSGEINKEVFKKRWANLVVRQKQNQSILNKLDDRPDGKRLAKAKQLQKDLGGPVKEWTYTIPYTRADGTSTVMIRNVKASSAQTATQAAIQDALNMFEHPQFKTHTPDFNKLNVMLANVEDNKKFAYKIPYTTEQNRYQTYDGTITAANRDEARDEIMTQAQVFFQMNNRFTPDYQSTVIGEI